MDTHTPGPWEADPKTPGDVRSVGGGDVAVTLYQGMKLIEVTGTEASIGPKSKPEALANARLIAAAPELLEALKELRYATTDKALDMADAAIAKATGATP